MNSKMCNSVQPVQIFVKKNPSLLLWIINLASMPDSKAAFHEAYKEQAISHRVRGPNLLAVLRYKSKAIVLKSMELVRICFRVNERRIWLILCMTRDYCTNCGLLKTNRLRFKRPVFVVGKGWSWLNCNHNKYLTDVFTCTERCFVKHNL